MNRPVTAEILRNVEVAATTQSPTDADLAQRTADLVGETIRRACKATSKSIRDLVAQAEEQVAAMKKDAETFIQSLEEIGDAHASRIESALNGLKSISAAIAEQRAGASALAAVPERKSGSAEKAA